MTSYYYLGFDETIHFPTIGRLCIQILFKSTITHGSLTNLCYNFSWVIISTSSKVLKSPSMLRLTADVYVHGHHTVLDFPFLHSELPSPPVSI